VEVLRHLNVSEESRILRLKLNNYLAASVIMWIVDPEEQIVEVHTPGAAAKELNRHGTLTAETILPRFELPLKQIFPEKEGK